MYISYFFVFFFSIASRFYAVDIVFVSVCFFNQKKYSFNEKYEEAQLQNEWVKEKEWKKHAQRDD